MPFAFIRKQTYNSAEVNINLLSTKGKIRMLFDIHF